MAQFLHITDAKSAPSIRRAGIGIGKRAPGVFCMPVLKNHLITHQWTRELRRTRKTPKIAIQFRISDREKVLVGRYNGDKLDVDASKAVDIVSKHNAPFGLEVIVPRKIFPKEVSKVYTPPKVVGWRYWPEAKGNKPCPCFYCQSGSPFGRKNNEKYNDIY